jgi:hypothetical protein
MPAQRATPTGLTGPMAPTRPMVPTGPMAPVAPMGPMAPTGPITPVAPMGPMAPTGPITPVAPMGPMAPTGPIAPTGPTAEEVWRHGLPGSGQRRPAPLRRWAGTGLTVILLIASAVVIYLRLHHPPFGVTGVAITGVTSGCTVDVTGRIGTTGGAGIVSYEWTFQPQLTAPQPMSQTVAAGQSAVVVTAAIEGSGQGSVAQTVTLRVLGPGQARAASARVVIDC